MEILLLIRFYLWFNLEFICLVLSTCFDFYLNVRPFYISMFGIISIYFDFLLSFYFYLLFYSLFFFTNLISFFCVILKVLKRRKCSQTIFHIFSKAASKQPVGTRLVATLKLLLDSFAEHLDHKSSWDSRNDWSIYH